MNSRTRFLETMSYGNPDHVPYFEEGIRAEVIRAWQEQGYPKGVDLSQRFPVDQRLEIQPEVDPFPPLPQYPSKPSELNQFAKCLDPTSPSRLPQDWLEQVKALRQKGGVLMLRVHRGFFQTMGVDGWQRFEQVIQMLTDQPEFVSAYMQLVGDFTAELANNILGQTTIDAAVFSEPIGGNHGPLISPRMVEEFVLQSYQPLLDVLHEHGVEVIIFRTYANARALIPSILKFGFNCLWACEVNQDAMDYIKLRHQYGHDLRFIGGIDLDALRSGKGAIRREIERISPLVADGGYVPLVDGRVRADILYKHYRYYRKLLSKITHTGKDKRKK